MAEETVSYIASISPRDIAFSLGRPDRIPTQITLMDITERPPYSRESAGNAVGGQKRTRETDEDDAEAYGHFHFHQTRGRAMSVEFLGS